MRAPRSTIAKKARRSRTLLGLLLLTISLLLAAHAQDQTDKSLKVTEKELRGAATTKVEPEYPAVARQIRLTGAVELEVSVDPSGSIEKVNVLRGNELLVGASQLAIKRWKFTPFRVEGQAVRAVGPIRFSFQM